MTDRRDALRSGLETGKVLLSLNVEELKADLGVTQFRRRKLILMTIPALRCKESIHVTSSTLKSDSEHFSRAPEDRIDINKWGAQEGP